MEKRHVTSSMAILVHFFVVQGCTPIGETASNESNGPSVAGVPSPGPAPAPAPAPTPAPNVPPAINISGPVGGTAFVAPASISISANATDGDGTVAKVQFYSGATLLGEDLAAPFSFTMSGVAPGNYSFTAKATDNSGATTSSAAVIITVNPPPPVGPDCTKVVAPTITGTLSNLTLSGGIGLGPGSGDFMPGAFTIAYMKSTPTQVINTNCSVGAPLSSSVQVNCNAQASGFLRVTLSVRTDVECVSGTSTVTLRIRDDVCRAEAVSNTVPFTLNVSNVCPAQQRVTKDGTVAPELTAGRLDQFGGRVAMSGNWAVVTALGDDQKTTNAGAAFVYKFNGTKWNYSQKLIPAELTNYSELDAVAISGNLIVLGAPYHGNYGALFVYRFNGSSWVQSQGQIEPSLKNSAVRTENFGFDLAISGSSVYVGAPGYYHGDPALYAKAGAVFVFTDNGSSLSETRVISASDKSPNDAFGAAVAASGSTVVVGAPGNSKAYVYNSSTEIKLAAGLSSGSLFGTSVAIASGIAVVGAPGAVNAQNQGSGGAVIFDAATGAKKQTLFGASSSIQFGLSVAANGSDLLVGAPSQTITNATRSGAAHMYRLNGGTYQPYFIFRPRRADQGFEDYFGESVDLGSGYIFGGARADDLADSDMGSAFFIKVP